MLIQAKDFLKPGGRLILAIENQLGLKYFAGAPEDHHGKELVGIEGRYKKGQARTFGKVELSKILEDADFIDLNFLSPFPDYKLPSTIITEEGFKCENFNTAAIVSKSAKSDPQMPRINNFSMELVYPQIFSNNLGLDMSNSFLIIAKKPHYDKNNYEDKVVLEKNILAYHYSTSRIKNFCKSIKFSKTKVD